MLVRLEHGGRIMLVINTSGCGTKYAGLSMTDQLYMHDLLATTIYTSSPAGLNEIGSRTVVHTCGRTCISEAYVSYR